MSKFTRTQKIARNTARDKEVSKYYKKQGWKIFRIWEHKIKEKGPISLMVKKILETIA